MKKILIGIVVIVLGLLGYGAYMFLRVSDPPAGSVDRLAQERLASSTVYSAAQVAAHSTEEDCWTIVGGTVYDMTVFIPQHPGGRALLPACGTDGTKLFAMEPAHTREKAIVVMDSTYKIGVAQ